jgi:hypothetical protein
MTGIDAQGVARWFARYLDTYSACARGDAEFAELMNYYAVPLLVTSDEGVVPLDTPERIGATILGQIDGLRAAGYHHTEVLNEEVTVLNMTSALYRGSLARVGQKGERLSPAAITYLVTDGDDGLRISVLAAHSA